MVRPDKASVGFGTRNAGRGRNFADKAGDANGPGEKPVDEKVAFYSNPFDEALPANARNREGFAPERTTWIGTGVMRNLGYPRFWAQNVPEQACRAQPAEGRS